MNNINFRCLDKYKRKGVIASFVFFIIVFSSVLWKISIIKSNASKNISTLQHAYAEYGFPVFASKIVKARVHFFAPISIEKVDGDFVAIVDRDVHSKIYPGSLVLLRRDKKNYLEGNVVSISNIVDLDSGGYRIMIKFNSSVKLDNSFETALVSVLSTNTIAVNNDNIGVDNGGSFVWLVKNDKFHKQYVKTGKEDGFKTEIKSGLKIGDVVVTSDLKQIKENVKARIVDDLLK